MYGKFKSSMLLITSSRSERAAKEVGTVASCWRCQNIYMKSVISNLGKFYSCAVLNKYHFCYYCRTYLSYLVRSIKTIR